MYYDFAEMKPSAIYYCMMQTLIPRPIAWVLSENENSTYNLAPFSYFNAVCSDPPLVMISVGKKPDGSDKDTRVNIEQRRDFIIHIASENMLDPVNDSAESLAAGISEVDRLGLVTTEWEGSRLPRLTDCDIAYACHCYDILEIGDAKQSLILGQVDSVYVNDDVMGHDDKGRPKTMADKVNPLGRLGAGEYMSFGRVLKRDRPV
ncbi:MAG: flavin reductase family protein [Gammaproteobacteria bacterium]|nr:MAG: flavin reductase family protein [Gammaproteobacteria bacterium]